MNKLSGFLKSISINFKNTIVRFPVVILILAFISLNVSLLIEDSFPLNEQLLTRFIYSSVFAVFLGITTQFLIERFNHLAKYQIILRASTFVIAILYFFLLTSEDRFSQAMFIRLFVCSFALFAMYLFLPSAKGAVNFGKIALVHFKSAFTSILYGLVLFLGLTAIYFAIDLLLFKLDNNIRGHIANFVFIFFTPVYYLSLLPKFNSKDELEEKKTMMLSIYPRVLEILVSYIVIPLITVFSAVLIIYFIKILLSGIWPVGQVGPMVLSYSAVGLIIYILGSNLDNRSAVLFRKLFPFALMPLVIMQLVSSYIRINAYGITESRYYVVIFGIFSLISALYLTLSKKKNSNMIVLLATCFAILSIIPPVDAFNISKNSQANRIEEILVRNNMLIDNKLIPNSSISNDDKRELTNITNYMARMGYLRELDWMDEKYFEENTYYSGFEKIYGFQQYYNSYYPDEGYENTYAILDTNSPIDITGFETFFKINIYSDTNTEEHQLTTFTQDGNTYTIKQKSDSNSELILSIFDENQKLIMNISMKEFFDEISEKASEPKAVMSAEDLTFDIKNDTLNFRLIIDNINIEKSEEKKELVNASIYVFVATP